MKIKQPVSARSALVLGVTGISVLLAGYWLISYRQHLYNPSDTTVPNFRQLAWGFWQICTPHENPLLAEPEEAGFFESVRKTWLFNDATATYGRLFKGLTWGCLLSLILGVLMGCYEWLAVLLLPPLAFLAKVPGTAMLAVFFVLVGTGEPMFAAMIGFGVLPTLTQSVYLAAKHEVHEEEVNKAYTLGASELEVVWNVVIRQVLPLLIENVRLQIGPAMVYLIAAEMLVGQVGMGYQIRMQQRLLNLSVVYDYLLILGATGLVMDQAMVWLRRKWCPWYSRWR